MSWRFGCPNQSKTLRLTLLGIVTLALEYPLQSLLVALVTLHCCVMQTFETREDVLFDAFP
jgi:hypothetical protein